MSISVDETGCDCAYICTCADSEENDEKESLEVE